MPADPNSYDNDVMAWANEQARLLRAGCLDALDIEHIADEIEDVGKSEQRELASRMAVLAGPSAQVAAATDTARRQLGNHRPESAQQPRADASLRPTARVAVPQERDRFTGDLFDELERNQVNCPRNSQHYCANKS